MNERTKSTNNKPTKGWLLRLTSGWMILGSSASAGFIACALIAVVFGNTTSGWFMIGIIAFSSLTVPSLILGVSHWLDQ